MHTFLWEGLEADIRIFMRILLALESRAVKPPKRSLAERLNGVGAGRGRVFP